MVRENEIRDSEVAVTLPDAADAHLLFIGRIRTPWTSRLVAPRQGRPDGPLCRIEVFEPWVAALDGWQAYERIEVLYWLHLSRRDLVMQSPASDGRSRGTFALRTPGAAEPDRDFDRAVWSASKEQPCWCAASTAWTARRCSTSSRIAPCSPPLPHPSPVISRPAIPEPGQEAEGGPGQGIPLSAATP